MASVGLNVNSTAVIIGAMLISPLMGPIVGSGFAMATYDSHLLKRSAKNLLIATLVGFFVSAIYFYLSPFKDVQSELLARTSPTIYDVLIAFFGCIVGAISITRIDNGNPIPGVAIATALMPPLCTAGFGLPTLNFQFIAGALYLYSINCFFIGISTFLILKYLKYKPVKTDNADFDKKIKIFISVLMTLMIIPSFYLAYSLLQEKKYTKNVEQFINEVFSSKGYTIIYKNIDIKSKEKTIQLAFLNQQFDSLAISQYNQLLTKYALPNTKLEIKQSSSDLRTNRFDQTQTSGIQLSEKDLQFTQLSNEINAYKVGNHQLNDEIKILFPDIREVYFGKLTDFSKRHSIQSKTIVLYQATKPIDESKLKDWLQLKLATKALIVLEKNQDAFNKD